MKVIFLQDVPRVGKRHDLKEVPDGYALNFLIPRKLAELATPKSLAMLEIRKNEIIIEKKVQDNLLSKNLEELKDKVVHIDVKADEKGHLFSGIHAKEIVEAMHQEHHVEISPEFIVLLKPFKEVGEFYVPVTIKGKTVKFKLVISKA